jgi:hypothetical protein
MKDTIKKLAKEHRMTQTEVSIIFKHQFQYVGKCITESFTDVENAKEIKIPYIGTFYPSMAAIKNIFKNHDRRKGQDTSEATAQDGHGA